MSFTSLTLIFSAVLRLNAQFVEADDRMECGARPFVKGSSVAVNVRGKYPVGATVEYTCKDGYIASGTHQNATSVCVKLANSAVWTHPCISCVGRHCGDPGSVKYACRSGYSFTYPNKVVYTCQEGYVLEGYPIRFCQANGTWSGRLPSCRKSQSTPVETVAVIPPATHVSSTDDSEDTNSRIKDDEISQASGETSISSNDLKGSCRTHHIQHGEFLLGKTYSAFDWTRFRYTTEKEYRKVENDFPHKSGSVLYISCEAPYTFQGTNSTEYVKVECVNKKWVPRPLCLRRSRPMLMETTTVYSPTVPLVSLTHTNNVAVAVLSPSSRSPIKDAKDDENRRRPEETTTSVYERKDISGCKAFKVKEGSELIIEPTKNIYRYGELVTFDCPLGLKLSLDIEVAMCLDGGWSEDVIPDCEPL